MPTKTYKKYLLSWRGAVVHLVDGTAEKTLCSKYITDAAFLATKEFDDLGVCTVCERRRVALAASATIARKKVVTKNLVAKKKVTATQRKRKAREARRRAHVKRTYGLTPEEHAALLAAQGAVCAICGGVRRTLDVDHCHDTRRVRGLLCARCNRQILRHARNNPDVLEAAAAYLRSPPAFALGDYRVPVAPQKARRLPSETLAREV